LKGKDEELTSILSVCPSFSNKKDKKDKTPLHCAIEGKYLSTCEILLDFGDDIFMKSNYDQVRIVSLCYPNFVLGFSSYLLWKEL